MQLGAVARRLASPLGLACALVALSAAAPSQSHAGGVFYTYTDGDGVTHFTNVRPGDPRYRAIRLQPTSQRKRRSVPARHDYDQLIGSAARTHRVPPALVKAVIAAESSFDSQAISRAGAQGLMQLMPTTAAALGVEDPFVPDENVQGGTRYLRTLIDRYGDLSRALAAYNAGPDAVDRYRGVPPYRETQAYVERVLTYYRHYHGDFAR